MADRSARSQIIHQAVAYQVANQPQATALIQGDQHISYETLEAAARTYAAELISQGVGPGQVVPLLLPRSPQLVALQLAVLMCGAAYTSLDRRWPTSRMHVILDQVRPAVLVNGTATDVSGSFRVYRPPVEDSRAAAIRSGVFESVVPDSSAPATVFFTSGSTGNPKGVVAPHRAITRLFRPGGLEGFGPGHTTPQVAPLPWDMYALELWGQLTSGGTVVLVEADYLLPDDMRYLIRASGVNTIWLTTSLFNLFIDEDPDCFSGLGHVIVGGETLSPRHIRLFLGQHPDITLHNGYGPAENCMLTTTHRLAEADCEVPSGVPIGTAVPGTRVLVLGPGDVPCPTGEPGEICIAGQGLALGYLRAPDLTTAKFPTVEIDGVLMRIYRTGDIGVMDSAGVLHFLGRRDRQVKIRGHRIEPAEIEMTAGRLADVQECTVLPLLTPDGQVSRLVMFYVINPGAEIGEGDDPLLVRQQLARLLPAYLIPDMVYVLDRFPVTENGKLDRATLQLMARRLCDARTARRLVGPQET